MADPRADLDLNLCDLQGFSSGMETRGKKHMNNIRGGREGVAKCPCFPSRDTLVQSLTCLVSRCVIMENLDFTHTCVWLSWFVENVHFRKHRIYVILVSHALSWFTWLLQLQVNKYISTTLSPESIFLWFGVGPHVFPPMLCFVLSVQAQNDIPMFHHQLPVYQHVWVHNSRTLSETQ